MGVSAHADDGGRLNRLARDVRLSLAMIFEHQVREARCVFRALSLQGLFVSVCVCMCVCVRAMVRACVARRSS